MDARIDTLFDPDEFLWRIVEQFRAIADKITYAFHAEAYPATDAAVLRIRHGGDDDDALRMTARFVGDSDGMEEKLALFAECQGEVTRVLALGWQQTVPDADAGLDSRADRIEGDYTLGRITRKLPRLPLSLADLKCTSIERGVPPCQVTNPISEISALVAACQTRNETDPSWNPINTSAAQKRASNILRIKASLRDLGP